MVSSKSHGQSSSTKQPKLDQGCGDYFRKEDLMETLFVIGLVAVVAYWFYKAGKHVGSRKGYGVGRSRRR